ncbi:MAG: hypothetical protein R3Y08_07870 [Rikenellaceae bacterium]
MINREKSYTTHTQSEFINSLPKIEINYRMSKEDVWAQMEDAMDRNSLNKEPIVKDEPKIFVLNPLYKRIISVAAMIVIFVGVSATVILEVVKREKRGRNRVEL